MINNPFLFILYINELVKMCYDGGCTGLYMNEMYPSVQLLIFADDVIMFNNAVSRLQHQASILSQFCRNYILTVYLSKTNVIVFRNGGIIRGN